MIRFDIMIRSDDLSCLLFMRPAAPLIVAISNERPSNLGKKHEKSRKLFPLWTYNKFLSKFIITWTRQEETVTIFDLEGGISG